MKIKANNVEISYGKTKALKNMSIEVKPNTITALIGPSGCGKTTFLRSLNRTNELHGASLKGEVFVDKEHINNYDASKLRKKVGMVFQQPNAFPMSIYENVAYGPKIHEMDKISWRVENSLKKVGLWEEVKDRLNKSALNLSGGQQQRLCIARALATEPDVILLDEPCSALDPVSTSRIESLMRDLKEQYTLIIVTHNLQQAKRVADYTCYLLNGEVVEQGETQKMFENPEKELTRAYVNGEFG